MKPKPLPLLILPGAHRYTLQLCRVRLLSDKLWDDIANAAVLLWFYVFPLAKMIVMHIAKTPTSCGLHYSIALCLKIAANNDSFSNNWLTIAIWFIYCNWGNYTNLSKCCCWVKYCTCAMSWHFDEHYTYFIVNWSMQIIKMNYNTSILALKYMTDHVHCAVSEYFPKHLMTVAPSLCNGSRSS